VNRGSDAVPLDRLSLSLRVADDHHASGMAAGSRLSWAVQADDGRGPLLAVHLHHGSVDRITGTGLELGPMRLAAQQRYVTQLGWEHYATPRSVVAALGRELLVPRTVHEVGEAVLLPDDPDAALVVPHEMTVDTVEEPELMGRELSVDEPGRHRVELRSAEGEVRLDLSWVLPLVDRLGIWSADVLAGPRTPAGVVAVDDVSAGLVVQAALGAQQRVGAAGR
jgi:hypothetical protein